MKNLFTFLLLNSFLFIGCTQSQTASPVKKTSNKEDLTTKEGILAHLKKVHEGIEEDDICIDEITGLPELFIVGYFAHDRGCGNSEYYFGGKEVSLNNKVIKQILNKGNFENDNLAAVEAYHIGVVNHYDHSLSSKPDDFDESKFPFTAPDTRIVKGLIVSKTWVQERSGMLPEVHFHLSTVVFELDGNLADHQTSNSFTVEY
ncbi:MAG: hypothetical protein ACI837_003375 [Crocinitomicaceae bacterium]|jgi:hypothetical protein